jgi:hypothetical protein
MLSDFTQVLNNARNVYTKNSRGRVGCRWLEAAVRVRGAVGRLGRSRGWLERSGDGRTSGAARAGSERLGSSAADGERGGKRLGFGRGGAVGLGPDRQTAPGSGPSVALADDVRRARVASGNREGRDI